MPFQLALTLPSMSRLDLTDEERADLARELRDIVANDRFPLSPRIRRLKRILDKLEHEAEPPAEPSVRPRRRHR
jgi:hypothetical protein